MPINKINASDYKSSAEPIWSEQDEVNHKKETKAISKGHVIATAIGVAAMLYGLTVQHDIRDSMLNYHQFLKEFNPTVILYEHTPTISIANEEII